MNKGKSEIRQPIRSTLLNSELDNKFESVLSYNRRGQVAIIMVFLVALVLIGFILFSFLSFDRSFSSNSGQLSEMLTEVSFAEALVRSSALSIGRESLVGCDGCGAVDFKKKFQQVADVREFRYEGAGNFFGEIRNGNFEIDEEGGEFMLKVDGLFVKSERGVNKIERNFDLKIKIVEELKFEVSSEPMRVDQFLIGVGTLNSLYTGRIDVIGGTGPYTFTVSEGELPPGLELLESGEEGRVLKGIPTQAGVFNFKITIEDSSGQKIIREVNLEIVKISSN